MPQRHSKPADATDTPSDDAADEAAGPLAEFSDPGDLSEDDLALLSVPPHLPSGPDERDSGRPQELQLALERLSALSTHALRVEAVLNAFYKDQRVARIFRSLPFVGRLDGSRDEARQRVAVLFLERYVGQMIRERQTAESFYRLIYALAFNMLRTMRRELQRSDERHRVLLPEDASIDLPGVRDNGLHAVSESELAVDTASLESTERRIDMQRAQREIAKRLAAKTAPKPSAKRASVDQAVVPGSGNVLVGGVLELTISPKMLHSSSTSDEDVRLLLQLRSEQGLTNLELAEQLGCTPAALASYIGHRVPPPERIMSAAHRLLHAAKSKRTELSGLSIEQIFGRWVRLLRLESLGMMDQNKAIGEVLGRDGSTIYRWRTRRVDMPVRDIDAFHQQIKSAAKAA